MTLVDVDELRAYMSSIDLSLDQEDAAAFVLDGLQAELESYLARPLEPGTYTETVVPDWNGRLFLERTPARRVLALNGVPTNQPAVALHSQVHLGPVTVTYEYGFSDSELSLLRLAILRAAAREMEQRHDDTRSVKDLTTRNEGESQLRQKVGFQPEELSPRLDRLRRRVVAT